ncbi:MAG TPA: hypothetical protein VNO70_15980 [Blastocatellia bacterium]|nr:hypothetical protein [Blastocatellia bacterium]
MNNRATALNPRVARTVLIVLGLWLGLAIGLGAAGAFRNVTAPVLGITNWSLVIAALLAVWRIRPLREWAMALNLRALVLYHAVRFVGVYFLILYEQGRLPYAFAVPGGWGDILVAAAALVVAFGFIPIRSLPRWWTVLSWNTVGLLDILMVVGTAIRLGLADMRQMAALTELPLSLLPTFIVPLVIATHALIFVRLWEHRARPEGL